MSERIESEPHSCDVPGCDICKNCGNPVWPDPMGGDFHGPKLICEVRIPRNFSEKECNVE